MSFTPPETSADLWLERSNFAAVVLGGVAYGVHLAIFAISMFFVIKTPANNGGRSWSFICLLCALFAVGTVELAAFAKFGERIWIDNRDFPGGPVAWFNSHYNDPLNILNFAGFVCANFIADGVLIYRLFVVWNKNVLIMIIPILSYLASTVLSVLAVLQTSRPNSAKWSHAGVTFSVPYWALTVSLNVFISVAIAHRLMRLRRRVVTTLGAKHAEMYSSVIVMIVESAAIYAITGVICIATFAAKSNALNFIQQILGQVVCICSELIILRVSRARSQTRDGAGNPMQNVIIASGTGSSTLNSGKRSGKQLMSASEASMGTISEREVHA